ncbi:hypothetical protein GCM10027261_36180 [Geodermatophilus arenarius]
MGDWAFWLARWALATAGAAFLCYLLVLVCLVVASRYLHPRPRHLPFPRARRRARGSGVGSR